MNRIAVAGIAGVTVILATFLGFLVATIYNPQPAQGQEGGGPPSDFDRLVSENGREIIEEGR